MSLAKGMAEALEQRKARAMVWIEGMRELSERAHRQTSRALDLCESALDWKAEAEVVERVIEVCKELEQYIGREHVATSPIRSDGCVTKVSQVVGQRRAQATPGQEPSGQIFLFEEEAE